MSYEEKFKEKGLTPLEPVKTRYQKVVCQDEEGYKYLLSLHGAVENKRTKSFDRWNKNNPFKPYNMRKFAKELEENVEILSTDEELREATTTPILFRCPDCGKPYKKKWCHWIGQPKGCHVCKDCANERSGKNRTFTYEQLKERYAEHGLKLLSSYEEYKGNGTRLLCEDKEGYRFRTNVVTITSGNYKGLVKFADSNENALYNLQHWCDLNKKDIKVLKIGKRKGGLAKFKCSCGNTFTTTIDIFFSGKQRCDKCVSLESQYVLKTREWLEQHDIYYVREYRFDDCKDKRALPFDFYIKWLNNKIILIEVDGQFHFYENEYNFGEKLKDRKHKDEIKNKYCEEKGYTLVRIPYWLYRTDTYKNILYQTFFG